MYYDKNSRKTQLNTWKAQLEALIALTAIAIAKERPDKNVWKLINEMNNHVKKTKSKNAQATPLQRMLVENKGS